jgi:hypothetical protein
MKIVDTYAPSATVVLYRFNDGSWGIAHAYPVVRAKHYSASLQLHR